MPTEDRGNQRHNSVLWRGGGSTLLSWSVWSPRKCSLSYQDRRPSTACARLLAEQGNLIYKEGQEANFFAALDRDSHKLFPPVYICTCQFGPVRDDGKVMIKPLAEVGVKTKYDHYVGLPHIFWIFPGIQERQTFLENTKNRILWVLEQLGS